MLISLVIFITLVVLTGIEYAVGTADAEDLPVFSSNLIPLALIALVKAGLIVNFYMHISRLWSAEEEEH